MPFRWARVVPLVDGAGERAVDKLARATAHAAAHRRRVIPNRP
ncbi:hypothetical protein [Engelhardtia mirabilis]